MSADKREINSAPAPGATSERAGGFCRRSIAAGEERKNDALTNPLNFKVSPVVEAAIFEEAAELGLSVSAYLRLCVYSGGPLLRACPTLKNLNRQELRELMEDIGKMLVIRPAKIGLRETGPDAVHTGAA